MTLAAHTLLTHAVHEHEERYQGLLELQPSQGTSLVLKRGSREPESFDIDKLRQSIAVAAKGRGNDSTVRALAIRVSEQAVDYLRGQPVVTSQQIAAVVLKQLRAIDDIAYLRYAATTKPFRSAEDFWAETIALLQHPESPSDGQ